VLYLAKPYIPGLEKFNWRKINGVQTLWNSFLIQYLNIEDVFSYFGNVSLDVILYANFTDLNFVSSLLCG
jgi:hypothetical protein